MAEERRRRGQLGRRHRRDRDRQGDDGGRGGRRGHARQDPGAGRHRGRRGQHADRRACSATARDAERAGDGSAGDGAGARAEAPRRRRPQPKSRAPPAPAPRRSAAPQAPREPEIPAGTEMVTTDRARGVARRHGRGDAPRPRRLPDGRGGRRVSGRLQGQQGLLQEFGAKRVDRHADHRVRLRRPRRRRGDGRPAGRSSSS